MQWSERSFRIGGHPLLLQRFEQNDDILNEDEHHLHDRFNGGDVIGAYS
ncbi:hypothetical protein J2D73_09155 [Acetobacter sacchari]|uniref:Uncharacterized protein n=1 Tax=Acetobacter sacchari TaxID=2661687 RepID=A0ABS3LVM6_9PROT|nr:hypothetical protein [Acetobacter sacchari]MBO1359961.1 hypothetical protein [Acetobacter sacchari]